MFDSYFSAGQQCTLGAAFLLAVLASIFHSRQQDRVALVLLLSCAVVLRMFAARLDPYLNMWDESVHALVAKNMSIDPLKPMLFREEALRLSITNWTENHVWLHKQPFFLWIMALSIKLFGPTVCAVRLPSVLFSTAWVFFTYGIAKALHGRNTAFMTAMLLSFTHWGLSQVAGFEPTDHNDVAFIALVGGSLWAWFVVMPKDRRRGVFLVGAFVGCAVLTKWLTGLLVFAGWGATIVLHGPDRWKRSGELLRALLIATVIVAPWQVYAWARFPSEMCNEMQYNARHLNEVLENHAGSPYFYFDVFPDKFHPLEPYLTSVLTLLGLLAVADRHMRTHALVTVVGLFVFFTIAASKMASYLLPIAPFCLMGIAHAIDRSAPALLKGKWPDVVRFCAVSVLASALLNIPRLQVRHTAQCKSDPYFSRYVPARLHNLSAMGELDALIGDVPRTIVFHVPYPENLNFAFYYGHEALIGFPDAGLCERLHAAGCSIVVVDPPDWGLALPSYVRVIRGDRQIFQAPE